MSPPPPLFWKDRVASGEYRWRERFDWVWLPASLEVMLKRNLPHAIAKESRYHPVGGVDTQKVLGHILTDYAGSWISGDDPAQTHFELGQRALLI